MNSKEWADAFDVIGDMLAVGGRLPGPQSTYITGAAAFLKGGAKVMRATGKSPEEILRAILPERELHFNFPVSSDEAETVLEKPKSSKPPPVPGKS